MRRHVEATQTKLPGWDNKPTDRPTAFMLTTKFEEVLVFTFGGRRVLARPLTEVQRRYLTALGLTPSVFTQPPTVGSSP